MKKKTTIPKGLFPEIKGEDGMEDMLTKDLKNIQGISTIPGFHPRCGAALACYLDALGTVRTCKVTTDVFAAYAALTPENQDNLGEMFTKKQIALIGLAAVMVKHKKEQTSEGLADLFKHLGEQRSDHDE